MPDPNPTETPSPQAAPEAASSPQTDPASASEAASGAEAAPSLSERARFNAQQAQLRRARKELPRQLETMKQAAERRFAEYDAQIKASQEESAKYRAELEKYRDNPLAAVPEDKRDDAIKRYALEGTPEARQQARIEALEKKIEAEAAERLKMREEYEAKQKADAEQQQKLSAEGLQRAKAQEIRNVTSAILAVPQSMPYTCAEFSPGEVEALVRQAQHQAETVRIRDPKTGQIRVGAVYSLDEVKKAIEDHAKAVYEAREERRKSLLTSATAEVPQGKPGSSPVKNGQGASHRATATAKSAPEPTGTRQSPKRRRFQLMTPEAEAQAKALLTAAQAKDRAARAKS